MICKQILGQARVSFCKKYTKTLIILRSLKDSQGLKMNEHLKDIFYSKMNHFYSIFSLCIFFSLFSSFLVFFLLFSVYKCIFKMYKISGWCFSISLINKFYSWKYFFLRNTIYSTIIPLVLQLFTLQALHNDLLFP